MPPPTWMITGTSSGLGLSLSQFILQRGHNLISISRHPHPDPSLIDLAKTYIPSSPSASTSSTSTSPNSDGSPTLHHIPLDLSQTPSPIPSTLHTFLTTHNAPTPDILINNAATVLFTPIELITPTELTSIMTTNFFSPTYLVQSVLPGMRRRAAMTLPTDNQPSRDNHKLEHEHEREDVHTHDQVIVNISSTQGLCAAPGELAYDASKHALEAMSDVLAGEVAVFGIRVMVVNLGSLRTGFARGGERNVEREKKAQGMKTETEMGEAVDEKITDTTTMPATDTAATIDDENPYTHPTHPVAKRIAAVHRYVDEPTLARGSPLKTASILFDAVMRTPGTTVNSVLEGQRVKTLREAGGSGVGKVERLVLGGDAQPGIERFLGRVRGDVEGCREVSGLVECE